MELDLPVTLAVVGLTLAIFVLASWRARQPAQPLKVRMVNYHVIQIVCIVVILVMAAHLVTLLMGAPPGAQPRVGGDSNRVPARVCVRRLHRPNGVFAAGLDLPAYAAPTSPVAATAEDEARFTDFLREFRAEALAAGIKPETYDRAVAGIKLNPKVQELNLAQPEFVRPVWQYLEGAVSEMRVKDGREAQKANQGLLASLTSMYGVPTEVLTAIWGLETAYGRSIGSFNIFEALATLAYQGPRAAYGRRQFLAALKIAEAEARDPTMMLASWAGAFGETQFVPTTFLERAVDGDGDGKRDPWRSHADALASTASYLKELGWRTGESWGEEVKLPGGFPYAEADPETRKTQREWAALGVRDANGNPLPQTEDMTAIFLPAGYRGPAFLLRANFNVILKYNFATSYALAIGLLSDRLRGAPRRPGCLADGPAAGANESGGVAAGLDGARLRHRRRRWRLRPAHAQRAQGLSGDARSSGRWLRHARFITRILNERYLQKPPAAAGAP